MSPARIAWILVLLALCGCATDADDPLRYRLASSSWADAQSRVPEGLRERYAEFFSIVLDPNAAQEPPLRDLRDDLERVPVTRTNFDALNALGEALRRSGRPDDAAARWRRSLELRADQPAVRLRLARL